MRFQFMLNLHQTFPLMLTPAKWVFFKYYTGLVTKNETVKTTQNSKNVTIWSLIFGFSIQSSILMVNKMLMYKK